MSTKETTILRALGLATACLLTAALTACGSTVPHRRVSAVESVPQTSRTPSGSSWSVVLPPEPAYDADLVWPGDAAFARRDAELASRTEGPVDGVASSWPQPSRPSLDDSRRLFVGRRAETMVYFRSGHHHERRYRTHGSYGW